MNVPDGVTVTVTVGVLVEVKVAVKVAVIEGEGVKVAVGEKVAVGVDVCEGVAVTVTVMNAVPSAPVMGITPPDAESSGCDERHSILGTLKAQMAITSSNA